ncbi:MAG TPA: hypothetical protein VLB50_04050 [Ignavibacteriaceae bacterium]|nr:hypothetical protein [Ignavibacteriaceae bacterium]
MNIILDLLGAFLIGGIVLLLVANLNAYSSETQFASAADLRLQQNAKTLAEIINDDLRKIGYKYSGTAISQADSQKISFYGDINNDGTMDLVTYYLGNKEDAPSTPNPDDRVMYRIVNNDTISGPTLGLTNLKFSYLNTHEQVTANPDSICYVKAEIWVETIQPVGGEYPFTYWEMTINPRNI